MRTPTTSARPTGRRCSASPRRGPPLPSTNAQRATRTCAPPLPTPQSPRPPRSNRSAPPFPRRPPRRRFRQSPLFDRPGPARRKPRLAQALAHLDQLRRQRPQALALRDLRPRQRHRVARNGPRQRLAVDPRRQHPVRPVPRIPFRSAVAAGLAALSVALEQRPPAAGRRSTPVPVESPCGAIPRRPHPCLATHHPPFWHLNMLPETFSHGIATADPPSTIKKLSCSCRAPVAGLQYSRFLSSGNIRWPELCRPQS